MFVYVISNPAFDGWLKVGKTKCPHTRLKTLQTAAPTEFNIEMLTEFDCDKPIHNRLMVMGYENSREWFKIDLDAVESVIADVITEWTEKAEYD